MEDNRVQKILTMIIVVLFAVGHNNTVHADRDDEKKAIEEWKKLEEELRKSQEEQTSVLENIMKLMDKATGELVESDTGEDTQETQRKIVEAMESQEDAISEMDRLIKEIEDSMEISKRMGSMQSEQSQKKEQDNRSEEEKKRDEARAVEAAARAQERARRISSPQLMRKKDTEQDPSDSKDRGDDKSGLADQTGKTEEDRRRGMGSRWGNLPPALRDAVESADGRKVPERYRGIIERYMKALATPKRDR